MEVLRKPITAAEIEWRVQSAKNGKMTVVPYITNRCVMERFDEAFTPFGWQNTFQEWRGKGVKCGIGVLHEGQWIWKFDGADESDIEATKGGFSDSMKRVAVQWGLGRDLYNYPRVFIVAEGNYIPYWANDRLNKMVDKIVKDGVTSVPPVITLEQK